MPESISFTAPQAVAPAANAAQLLATHKRRPIDPATTEGWSIHVEVIDEQGRIRDFEVRGPLAKTLILALNKTNNTIKTEDRRILEWLQANNNPATGAPYLPAGTFTGAAD